MTSNKSQLKPLTARTSLPQEFSNWSISPSVSPFASPSLSLCNHCIQLGQCLQWWAFEMQLPSLMSGVECLFRASFGQRRPKGRAVATWQSSAFWPTLDKLSLHTKQSNGIWFVDNTSYTSYSLLKWNMSNRLKTCEKWTKLEKLLIREKNENYWK